MKLHHKIIALVIGAAFAFASVTMIIDYSMSRDKLLNDYSSLNKNRDSKTSSDKKVRYIENSVNESGSISIVTQDSGTFGDLAQGSSNSSFGSAGDNTSNKQTNDGESQNNSGDESSESSTDSNSGNNDSNSSSSSSDSTNQSSGSSSSQGSSSNEEQQNQNKNPNMTGYALADALVQALKNAGYDTNAICGIVGNCMVESGGYTLNLDPNAVSGSGTYHGIAQWGNGRYKSLQEHAAKNNTTWNDGAIQISYLINEATTSSYYSRWCTPAKMNGKGTDEATLFWLKYYEGAEGQAEAERVKCAKDAYDAYFS